MTAALACLAGVGLVVAAAKAHGRQVRLEREARGHFEVDFRRENDPWVEGLWRRDRRAFWPTFAALGAGALALGVAGLDVWLAVVLVEAAFAGAFGVAGMASLRRLVVDGVGDARWRAAALRGSAGWWMLALLFASLTVAAWALPWP